MIKISKLETEFDRGVSFDVRKVGTDGNVRVVRYTALHLLARSPKTQLETAPNIYDVRYDVGDTTFQPIEVHTFDRLSRIRRGIIRDAAIGYPRSVTLDTDFEVVHRTAINVGDEVDLYTLDEDDNEIVVPGEIFKRQRRLRQSQVSFAHGLRVGMSGSPVVSRRTGKTMALLSKLWDDDPRIGQVVDILP